MITKKDYKKAFEKTKIFSGRKRKKQQYDHKRYKNLSEDKKEELVEHRKSIIKREKKSCYN